MRSLLDYFPPIAGPLTGLMELMMRSDQGLKKGERELIAAFVSRLNYCTSCENIHSAVACHLNGLNWEALEAIKTNFHQAPITKRLKSLLDLAEQVQQGGNKVTSALIDSLKTLGCSDQEIHDTVLISSLFCMFNRYLDGLGIVSHGTTFSLNERGKHIALHGYSAEPQYPERLEN